MYILQKFKTKNKLMGNLSPKSPLFWITTGDITDKYSFYMILFLGGI